MEHTERFPWMQFIRAVATIAVPVALQNLLTTTGSMVDTLMISSLGQTSVGAVGLCAQFSSLFFSGYWGFVGGGMLFFSQYWGNKDHDSITRSYGITMSFLLAVGLLFGLVATLKPDFIMRLYTDKEDIQKIGIEYLQIVGLSYPIQVVAVAMSALLRSTERVRVPLIGSAAALVTNVTFNALLIHGHLWLPALGVRGAAIATVMASIVNVLTIVIVAKVKKYPYLLEFRRHFRWTKAAVREYLRKCFPIICNELLIGVGLMCVNMVLGRQSENAIAATAVFRTLEGFVIGFFAGFSIAASVLVGKSVGAGELKAAYERAKRLVLLCGSCILCVCLLLIASRHLIINAMHLYGEAHDICANMLLIYCVAAVIRMCNWTQNDTFRSAGDATFGTLLEITFMFVMVVPCVYVSGMVLKLPYLLVFACCYIDEPIRVCMMLHHLRSGKWIRPVTPEGKEALPQFMQELHEKKA